jgi:hypothetical protein
MKFVNMPVSNAALNGVAPLGSSEQMPAPVLDWGSEILRVWGKGDNTLELAGVVRAARQRLRRGQWTELWRSTSMPFCKRKAQMLVVIHCGLHWLEGSAQISARLPRTWNTLYYLAQLERTNLEQLVQEGVVHPQLKLEEAKDLVGRGRNGRPVTKSKYPPVLRRLEKLANFVDSTLDEWSPGQLVLAKDNLEGILGKIASREQSRQIAETTASHGDALALSVPRWQNQSPALGAKTPFTERTLTQQSAQILSHV